MKKIISSIILFCVMANTAYTQTAGDRPIAASQSKGSNLSISLRDGKLILNKIEVSKDWKLDPLVKVLGSEGRTRPGYNTTHSYDDFGIVLFEKTLDKEPTGEILEFQVFISGSEKNDVTPYGLYNGKLEIEKKEITIDLSLTDLRKKLEAYTESKSYMPHNFRFAKNGIYMYVQYDENDMQIQKISIGKDHKG